MTLKKYTKCGKRKPKPSQNSDFYIKYFRKSEVC